MGTVLVFANPISGRGRARAIAEKIGARLQNSAHRAQLIFDPPGAVDPAHLPDELHAAVSIGGDGTLRGVAELLLGCKVVPPLLVVPLGTANLMARHLRLKYRAHALDELAAALLLDHRVTHLDAAWANDQLFLLMAGVGLDASVVHELSRLRRGPIRMASYALPAALALRGYAYPHLSVTVDGQMLLDNEPALTFVGNVKEYGTGFPILADARSDDGLLDVCVLPCRSVLDLPRILMLAVTGDHLSAEGVIYAKGKTVRIESGQDVPVQIDGDAAGHLPLNIRLLERRLPFIVAPEMARQQR